LKKYSKSNFLKGDGKCMFKKILLSSVLLTGALGASTALAQTNTVSKATYSESEHSVASEAPSFYAGPIDLQFSTKHIVDELLHVSENNFNTALAIQNNKHFKYNVLLRNIETNELRHATIKGGFVGGQYQNDVYFGALEAGSYEVTLVNTAETEQQAQLWMWAYQK
jgi:hypothetical protein